MLPSPVSPRPRSNPEHGSIHRDDARCHSARICTKWRRRIERDDPAIRHETPSHLDRHAPGTGAATDMSALGGGWRIFRKPVPTGKPKFATRRLGSRLKSGYLARQRLRASVAVLATLQHPFGNARRGCKVEHLPLCVRDLRTKLPARGMSNVKKHPARWRGCFRMVGGAHAADLPLRPSQSNT